MSNPGASIQERLRQGLEHQQRGRRSEAEHAYRDILQDQPDNFHALYLLGMMALESGKLDPGITLLCQATAADPRQLVAQRNLGRALRNAERLEDALGCYDRAVALAPNDPDAHLDRARTLLRLNRPEAALMDFDRSVQLKESAEAQEGRGVALGSLGRHEDALAALDRAIAHNPSFASAHGNRGLALENLERHEEALASFDRALTLSPDDVVVLSNRGHTLFKMRRLNEALASFNRAIALQPGYANAHSGRGSVLNYQGCSEEAVASHDQAIACKPGSAELHVNRGIALFDLGRPEAALDSFDRATALRPDLANAWHHKSATLLTLGRFAEGWRLYEWRKKVAEAQGARVYRQAVWLGTEEINGRTLFVYWEQGFGDTIQFFRYVALAEARGAKVILSVQDPLMRLLKNARPDLEILSAYKTPPAFDYHTALLSLPLAFGTTPDTIPGDVPYLHAEIALAERWKQRIGTEGFKIGICWQGSNRRLTDGGRSFSVTFFEYLSRLPSVRLISLQKGPGLQQLDDLPPGMKVETLGEDFDSGPDAFVDTAAVMASLDLIITSDTSVAHVAGALGRPTWLSLRYSSEMRWLRDRRDSPWYPTMRLFRQPTYGDWKSVFADMETELIKLIE